MTFSFTSPCSGCVSRPLQCDFYEGRSFARSWPCAQSPGHRTGSWSASVKRRTEGEPTALQTRARNTFSSGAHPSSESLCGRPNAEPKPLPSRRSLAPGCPLSSGLLLLETVPQLTVLCPPWFVLLPALGAPACRVTFQTPRLFAHSAARPHMVLQPRPAPRCAVSPRVAGAERSLFPLRG